MELFDVDAGNITLNPTSLYIPEFKELWDRDKSVTKERATHEIAYIVFLCSYSVKNPYNVYAESIKEQKVNEDTIKGIPDESIERAIKKYKEMQETTYTRLLASSKGAAEKLAGYFDDIDFSKIDAYGKPIYSGRDLTSNLKEVGNIIKSLTSLEKQVQRDLLDNTSIRGGSSVGPFELPRHKEAE